MQKNVLAIFSLLFLCVATNQSLAQKKTTEPKPENGTVFLMSKGMPGSIYVGEKKITSLNKDEALEYKMISRGRITFNVVSYYGAHQVSVEVTDSSVIYLLAYWGGIKVIDAKEWYRERNNILKTIKEQENPDDPVLSDSKNTGPSQATCFAISSKGYLITNYHCVEKAKEVTVKGIDGDFTTKYGAIVVASDPSNDLALIKIGNKNVTFAEPVYGLRSSGVAQAEKVYALGFPAASAMGAEVKITEGIISSKSGVAGDISKFQISAAVNPGNSGGPLVDEQGNLIGVIYAKSTVAESAGYAVKASYLETFLKNIDGFEMPVFTNTIKDKPFTGKVAELKNYIFILERK